MMGEVHFTNNKSIFTNENKKHFFTTYTSHELILMQRGIPGIGRRHVC